MANCWFAFLACAFARRRLELGLSVLDYKRLLEKGGHADDAARASRATRWKGRELKMKMELEMELELQLIYDR